MHVLVLVAGDNVRGLMAPFFDGLKCPPRTALLEDDLLLAMASRHGVPPTETDSLLAHVEEWTGWPGRIVDGRLGYVTTDNPQGKYEWYRIGGRFDGYLRLKEARPRGWWARLLGRGPTRSVNRARKDELDQVATLEEVPFALITDGEWHDAGGEDDATWPGRFRRLFDAISDETTLHVVDAHC